MDPSTNGDGDFGEDFDTVFGDLPNADLGDPFGFDRRSSVQSEDSSNIFGNFMADDTLGTDFPLDLEADDDTNDLLTAGLSPDPSDSLQSSYFSASTSTNVSAQESSSLAHEARCTTLVSLLTSSHSSLTTTSTTISSVVTAGHHGAGKPMSVLAAEVASKARQEVSKRGPGRPRSDGKLPPQRSRPHFPGRPANRIRNRLKSPSLNPGLPPPPSLQLGPKIRPSVSESSLLSPSLTGVSRGHSMDLLSGESLPRSCHECRLIIEETKFLSCDNCDKGYHLQCFKPPVSALPKNPSGIGSGWKCTECRVCNDCGSKTPGAGASCRWHLNYSVCDSCYQLRNRGSCCPVCRKAYRVAINTDMIQCTSCRKMVHPECDSVRLAGLSPATKNKKDGPLASYVCPVCEPVPVNKDNIAIATVTSGVSSRNSSTASLDELTDATSNENIVTRDSLSSFNDESLSSIDFAEGIDTVAKVEAEESLLQPQEAQVFQHPRPAHVGGKFPGKKRFSSGSRPRNSGGKFTGKKRPKTADIYRRKRTPTTSSKPSVAGVKPKPLSGSAASGTCAPSANGQASESIEKMKDDEPQVETKMVLCSAKDDFVLSQDVCVMCGSLGKGEEGRLIGCSQCGQCYHPYCVNIKVTKVVLTKGWRCLDCTVCEGCGLPHDEAKLLLCDECDISYHTYCLDPPLEEIPQGTWKCNWCVVCVKCSSTSPGTGSLWQKNYTECGPCASESTCPVCSVDYQENDLIIQCLDCKRWLHSHCDGMDNEQDCELAADFGYHCVMCRPKEELAAHAIVRKAMQAKVEEMALLEKAASSQQSSRRTSTDLGPNGVSIDSKQDFSSVSLQNRLLNRSTPVHTLDGVILSDAGHSFIKSLFLEPTKKSRSRKKANQANQEQEEPIKEDDVSLEDPKVDELTGEKKRAKRNNKSCSGVGGFSIRNRSRTTKGDSENIPAENDAILDNSAQAKRRRRRAKKKSQLSDSFPEDMQIAFFGMSLALPEAKTENGEPSCKGKQLPPPDLLLSGDEEEDDDYVFHRKVSNDKVIQLPSRLRAGSQTTIDSKKGDDSSDLLEDDEDLQAFRDLLPEGDKNLMDILISEGLDREAGSLTDALQGVKEEDEAKDSADDAIVGDLFDIDMVTEGLPHMDSQDVDDIFSGVLSPNGGSSGQEFHQPLNHMSSDVPLKRQLSEGHRIHLNPQMMPQGFPPPTLSYPNTMQGQVMSEGPRFPHLPPQMSHHSVEALPSMSPSIAARVPVPPAAVYPPPVSVQNQDWNQNNNSQDNDGEQTQGQKNIVKWEIDEALGELATISPVIYANLAHPNLKRDFPIWTERCKQIQKLWRQLPTPERQPYLLKARENRAASRVTKAQSESRTTSEPSTPPAQTIKTEGRLESDQERQWKQLQANRAVSNQEGRPELHAHFSDPGPSSHFESNIPGDASHRQGMLPPGVRPTNRPHMHSEGGQQPMKPSFEPLKIQGTFDPYSLPPGTPRPPIRPMGHQRFSPGASSSSPSTPMTPGDRPAFQSTPPHRPSSRDSFTGETANQQTPSSPQSQPKTPVASSPFHPSSPSVDHFAQTPSRPQSQPHAPFSPMTSHGVPSPARHQAGTPGSTPADFETSSPFARPPSLPGTPNEGFPSPQTSHVNSPLTPTEGNVTHHPLKASTSQHYDPNDPYSRPVMTPRPNTSTEGGFSRPIRPPVHQYPFQFNPQQQGQRRPERFIRPTSSDPYSHQPSTPMPSPAQDPYSNPPRTPMPFARQEEESSVGPRQQLRDLLQGQRKEPMRQEGPWMEGNRPRLPTPNQGFTVRAPSDGFRPPLPPSMRPPRLSHMSSGQFRHPGEPQRMMMQRLPFDPRMRQMLPPTPQMMPRHPQNPQQWQQQQQHGMRMSSPNDFIPQFNPQRHPMQHPSNGHPGMPPVHIQRPPFGQQIPQRHHEQSHGQHPQDNDTLTDNDPGLPDDIEDDELLGLGSDFNLLEYADPELDEALGVTDNKNLFDEHFPTKEPPKSSDCQGGHPQESSAPPPYPKQDEHHQPPPYSDQFTNQGPHQDMNPNQGNSLINDLDFENIKADLLGDDPVGNQQQMHPHYHVQNPHGNQMMFEGQQQQQPPQQWMNQQSMNPDPRFMQQQGGYPNQRFQGGPPSIPRMPVMVQRPQMPGPPPSQGHPALIQAMGSRPRQSLPKYQMPPMHPEPPFPVDEPITPQDHEVMANYRKWLFDQKALLDNEQRRIESEVARLRKIKKTINAKARQLKKTNQEISHQEAAELQQSINDLTMVMKGTEAIKKALRQHQITWENFDNKFKARGPLPPPGIMPQAMMNSPGSSMSSLPRSVSSPMISSAGPGTPSLPPSSTPQSPAHMSPSHVPPSPGNMMHSPHGSHSGHLSPGHAHAPNSPMIQSPVYQQRSPMMPHSGDFEQSGPPGGMRQPMSFQQSNHPPHRMPVGHQMGNHFQGMPRPGPHMNQTMMSPGGQRYPHPQQQMHGQQVFDPQQSQQFRNRHPNPEFSGDHVQNPGFHSSEQVYLRHPSQQMQFRPQFVSQQHSQQQPPVSQHLPISQAGQHSIHQMNHPHHQGPPQQQMYPQQHQFQHHHQMQQNTDFVQPNQERPMPESGNEDVEEAKTSMTLNFEEKGLGAESQAGNEALFQTEKNNDSSQVTENENSSQMIVTLVKSESICENDPHSQGNEAANSSLTGESMDFEEPFLSKQDLTITVIAPTIENSDESEEAKELERKRKNVLLKQLLQNCPSADPSATFSTIVVNTEPDSESIEISVERDVVSEEASVKQNEVAVVLVPASGDQLIQESSTQNTVEFLSDETATKVIINSGEIPHNELSNETAMEGLLEETSETRNQRPPPVERKMSYLDIRRALLEREPTPPPEAVVKPKRKRNPAKRKESKAVKEAAVIPTVSTIESTIPVVPTSSSSGSVSVTPTTTPPVKKRARKGSQIKAHSDDDHDALVSRVMTQLKKLPTMNVVEPKIKTNLNSVVPSGVGDLNTLSPIIRGCYGQGFIPVDDDRVSSISGQVHPVSSARAPLKGFYNQEFPGSTRVLNTIDYACILRETSSPDPFIPPSPETHLFREPDPRFSQVELTKDNDQKDQELKSPASPEIPSFIEIQEIDWDKMVSPPSSTDSDPDRDKENVLLSGSKVSGMYTPPLAGGPLKDSGNVAVTLTLSADAPDIKRVLGALAKLLEIEPPSEYQIVEHSQFGETKKETMDIKSEFPFCQSCDQRILNGEKKALPSSNGPCDLLEKDGKVFCSSPCLQRFCSSDNDVMDTFDAEQEDFKSIIEEKKIPELEEEPMELHQDLPEPSPPSTPIPSWSDEILSKLSIPVDPKVGIIDSRKWMGIKYHNWTPNLFEPSNPVEEENAEELAGLLESLDIVIKKENLPNDGRKCAFCHEIGDRDADGPARLLNYDVDKWVHLNCALWSTEVYETLNGALMSVDVALTKASTVSCVKCHKMGASIRCFKVRCTNVFHFACALTDNRCMFLKDKSFFCGSHAQKASVAPDSIMSSFVVNRRVYINRDDYKQLEVVIQDHGVMRIGSLVVMNIGQLLPTQLNNFHSSNCIFPVGYKVARFYWSRSHLGKRKKYICSIIDTDGSPEFLVEEQERGNTDEQPVLIARGSSPRIVWRQIVESVANMNRQEDHIKVFADQMTGEDLFGLTEQSVVRILESMQGVDTLQDYNFRYVRSQLLELPLAVNPSGCARTEPKLRTHFKRPHTMHTSNPSRSSLQSSFSSVQEVQSPYVKQFVHSKSSQYRKMKTEWRNNVYLARSRIAGLGLFAARDIEKHTMVIEYIGLLIRNELAERNERMYEQQNRGGVYMFRLDDNTVIDATLQGGLARYINHSCNPNCVAEQVQIDRENKIIIFANRRILKGEELAYDYRFDLEDDSHKLPCMCGAIGCRKWMN